MAVTITEIATGVNAASGDDVTTSATVTATTSNNDWLVVLIAIGNEGASSPVTGVSDSVGNTYTERSSTVWQGTGANNTGAVLDIYTTEVTTNITNGTITVTNSNAGSQTAVQVYRVRPAAGEVTYIGSTTGSGSNTTSHSAPTVSVSNANTIFGVAAIETDDALTGDSDTTNGSWSAIDAVVKVGGTDETSLQVASQYKSVNATGNQSWVCSTTSARDSARSYLVLRGQSAASSIVAALGQYTLSGTAMTPRRGKVPIVAGAGSYALTGTAATFINSGTNKTIAAGVGSYSLLGTDVTTTHGYKLDATTAGSYALTGTDATLRRALPMVADLGVYALTGTDATLTKASIVNKVLGVDPGVYALTGTDASLRIAFKLTVDSGSYALTGSAAALVTAANKVLLAEAGSYALVGTDVVLTAGVAPPSVSPLHIGEWPIDKKKRRAREDARAKEQRARDRFRRAIARLLEGLPPEFDEPEALDEALDRAVQASNLLYAMSAPIREINAVNELIDHIRQLRIAQPIAQLAMAQAYNQAHRHLKAKAQEDDVMALLLGE